MKMLELLQAAMSWPRRTITDWRKPDGWTALSVLVQLIGIAVTAFVYVVLLEKVPFIKNLNLFWFTLIIADLVVITWAKLLFHTDWYSLWFVENHAGFASVGRSKGSDGVTKNADGSLKGLYPFRRAWQGKPCWVKLFVGINMVKVIIIDKEKSGKPVTITYKDQKQSTLYYKANLNVIHDLICLFAMQDETRVLEDFETSTDQAINEWCRTKTEKDLFRNIGSEDGDIRIFIKKIYGEDNVPSQYELDRGVEIKCLTFVKVIQDAASRKLRTADQTFRAIGKGIAKMLKPIPKEMQANMDGATPMILAAQVASEAGQGATFIAGGKGAVNVDVPRGKK